MIQCPNFKEVSLIIGSSSYALPGYLLHIDSLFEFIKEFWPQKQNKKTQLLQDIRQDIEVRIQIYKNKTLRPICELEEPGEVEGALHHATIPTALLVSDVLQFLGQSAEKFYQEFMSSDKKLENITEEIFYIDNSQFPYAFEERITNLFSSYKETIQKNVKAYAELLSQPELIIDFAESIFEISLSVQVGIYLIIEISKGNLPPPKFEVMEEMIYRTVFLSTLFRQKSRKYLWSKTRKGQEQESCLRSLIVKAKRLTEQRKRTLTEEEQTDLEERNVL